MPLFTLLVVFLFAFATTGTEGAFKQIDPSSKVYMFSDNRMSSAKAKLACEAENMVNNVTENQQKELIELCKEQAETNPEGDFSKSAFWWAGVNGIEKNSWDQCTLLVGGESSYVAAAGVYGCTTVLSVSCNQAEFPIICLRKMTSDCEGECIKSAGQTAWELSKSTAYVNVLLCVLNVISTF